FAAALLVVAVAVLGGTFFYNANILNAYTDVHTAQRRVKTFETKYKPLQSLPQPRLVSVTLQHDYFPERRAATWHGVLRAVNHAARAIDTVFFSVPATGPTPSSDEEATSNSGLGVDSLAFDRDASMLLDDPANGVRLYRLSTPLAAGESLTVRFAGHFTPKGFPNDQFNNDVAYNGSFMNSSYVPTFGYQEGNELGDDDIRKRNGL